MSTSSSFAVDETHASDYCGAVDPETGVTCNRAEHALGVHVHIRPGSMEPRVLGKDFIMWSPRREVGV